MLLPIILRLYKLQLKMDSTSVVLILVQEQLTEKYTHHE